MFYKKNIATLKWFKKRYFFLIREYKSLLDFFIYQKESQFILHKYNAHRCPYQSMLFYNLFGRILFSIKEFIALVTNEKLFKKSIKLEGYDKFNLKDFYKEGNYEILYPKSPYVELELKNIEDDFFEKIESSLKLAINKEQKYDACNPTWEKAKNEFSKFILDENGKIIKDNIIKFRENGYFEKIITDEFNYINVNESYFSEYLKSIDLVLEYHRYAKVIKKEILSNLSESRAGENCCTIYRGKRISEKSIFYSLCCNDITRFCTFTQKRKVICDIGAGYGGLVRELKHYMGDSCYILIDLPEVIVFASYYIKYAFNDAKIALLEDVLDDKKSFNELTKIYDFIILPPSMIDKISDNSLDLVINTASFSFMSEKNLNEYILNISRTLKKGGYFYSINTSYGEQFGGVGAHKWDLIDDYLTEYQAFNNRFAYPQWLGKKV